VGEATTTSLSVDAIESRRQSPPRTERVVFAVRGLYGLSTEAVRMPIGERDSIDSGQVCITLDPESDPSANCGVIDFERGSLTVRYGVQAVFPGLHRLVTENRADPSLLRPVRAVATDQCTLTDDRTGWHAMGCLEFLPGSIWSGARGG
jgi:hypothetical protein